MLRRVSAPVVGEVREILADGGFLVDYPHNQLGPLEAQTITDEFEVGSKVLLTFENGDISRPIVLGVVRDRIKSKPHELRMRATRIVLEASEQITLQCGESRMEASGQGQVRIAGKDIVSRASRTNKVQGATVRMN